MNESETIIEERLIHFYQLMNTNSKKATRYYNKEIFPLIEEAMLDGDSDFLMLVADIVRKQLIKN